MKYKYYEEIVPWMPDYARNFSDVQKAALDRMLQIILQRDPGKHVLNVPCGCGKTTVIGALIGYSITYPQYPITALIITDRKLRLSEYGETEGLRDKAENPRFCFGHNNHVARRYEYNVVNLSDSSGQIDMETVLSSSIVLLTLQKWNAMDKRARDELTKYIDRDENKVDRDMMIVDEAILSHEVIKITNKDLNRFRGLLRDNIRDPDEMEYAVSVYSDFLRWIEEQEDASEQNEQNVVLPFVTNRSTFAASSAEDDKFNKIVRRSMDGLCRDDIGFCKAYEAIRNLLNPEACTLFCGGSEDKTGYRYFLTRVDHLHKLDVSIPLYILDGSAGLDITYRGWGTFHSFDEFVRPMDNVDICFTKAKTNITYLKDDGYRMEYYKQVNNMLSKADKEHVLVTTYKKYKAEVMQCLSLESMGTYGDITGKNDWRNCNTLYKLGLLREPHILSLLHASFYHPEIWQYFKQFDPTDPEQRKRACAELNAISADKTPLFRKEIDEYELSAWVCDFLQEIYRLRIRNYTCMDPVKVYLFSDLSERDQSNIYTQFFARIKQYFEEYNAKVRIGGTIATLERYRLEHRLSSKGNGEPAVSSKIMTVLHDWLEKYGEGYTFRRKELMETAGITNRELRSTVHDNTRVREALDNMVSGRDRRGIIYTLKYC